MLKISVADCLGLSPVISPNFTLEMCQSKKLQKKITKTRDFDSWMSSVSVLLDRWSAVLVMISSKTVSISDRSHARRANSGKITIS